MSGVRCKFYKFVFSGEELGVVVAKPYIDSYEQRCFFYRKHAIKALSFLFYLLKATLLIKANF